MLLPAAVRPWAQARFGGDKITLSHCMRRPVASPAGAPRLATPRPFSADVLKERASAPALAVAMSWREQESILPVRRLCYSADAPRDRRARALEAAAQRREEAQLRRAAAMSRGGQGEGWR